MEILDKKSDFGNVIYSRGRSREKFSIKSPRRCTRKRLLLCSHLLLTMPSITPGPWMNGTLDDLYQGRWKRRGMNLGGSIEVKGVESKEKRQWAQRGNLFSIDNKDNGHKILDEKSHAFDDLGMIVYGRKNY